MTAVVRSEAMGTTDPRKPAIIRIAAVAAHDRGGGARTRPLVTAAVGAGAMLNGVTDIDPGAAIPLHFHNCEESVTVLAGSAVASIDGSDHALEPGDTTWIPAGVPHRFRNPSAHAALRILWTYASIDADRTIIATGETRRIDGEPGLHRSPSDGEAD